MPSESCQARSPHSTLESRPGLARPGTYTYREDGQIKRKQQSGNIYIRIRKESWTEGRRLPAVAAQAQPRPLCVVVVVVVSMILSLNSNSAQLVCLFTFLFFPPPLSFRRTRAKHTYTHTHTHSLTHSQTVRIHTLRLAPYRPGLPFSFLSFLARSEMGAGPKSMSSRQAHTLHSPAQHNTTQHSIAYKGAIKKGRSRRRRSPDSLSLSLSLFLLFLSLFFCGVGFWRAVR